MDSGCVVLDKFYCVEGIDGSGKSAAVSALKELCERRGREICVTREPADSRAGLLARAFLSSGDSVLLSHLFAADRYLHLYGKGGIYETVRLRGVPVVSDRYFFSNLVYQTWSRESQRACGLGIYGRVDEMNAGLNRDFPYPSAVFYLKADPHVAVGRISKRGDEVFGFTEGSLRELARGYDMLFETLDKRGPREMRIITVDADMCAADIAGQMHEVIFGGSADSDEA